MSVVRGQDRASGGFRRMAALTVAAGLAVACGKAAAPAAAGAAGGGAAATLPAAATATSADPVAQDKLARAMAAVRCQLIGGAVADPQVYAAHGFASPSAYAAAWQAAAAADPTWAAAALTKAQATPCPGSAALGRAATPVDVPADPSAEGM